MATINKKSFFSIIFLIVFSVFVFFLYKHNSLGVVSSSKNIRYLEIGEQKIKTEIVATPELQERGLSGRKKIEENEGMLFAFKNPGIYHFWMKDMNFPIDIIWLDENFKVVFLKENALPESFPETFSSRENAKYVLEVASGFSEKNNLKEGDTFKILP